jgi:hypothetical protein
VALTIALGLALGAGTARADGPGAAYGGEEIGTIRYLNRAQSVVILTDGNEFHAPDPAMLNDLQEGEVVRVDFTHDYERGIINSIEPANVDMEAGASPSTEPGPHEH